MEGKAPRRGGARSIPQVLTRIAAYIRSQIHLTVNHDNRVLLPMDWNPAGAAL